MAWYRILRIESANDSIRQLGATVEEVIEAQDRGASLTYEETRKVCPTRALRAGSFQLIMCKLADRIVWSHAHDPNFPSVALKRIQTFLMNTTQANGADIDAKQYLEVRVQIALLTSNSPYAEVRAVVDCTDDPSLPVATIRAWIIGLFFVVILAFVNQLFSVRQPSIGLDAVVAQLLSYPLGKAAEKFLPDIGITLYGVRHSLNPGPFNQKEHMLISIMASVGKVLPSSRYISEHQE